MRPNSRAGAGVVFAAIGLFIAEPARAADFSAWSNRTRVVFNYTAPETLTNFPALVVFATDRLDVRYDQFRSSVGGDLRFADRTGTNELNYEIEQWNTNALSYVWVQAQEFTNNCYIWMFWGNQNATNPPAYTTNGAAWDSAYNGVWHLNRTNASGDLPDSTANNRTGANTGTISATGFVGYCRSFTSTTYVTLPTLVSSSALGSVSAWLYTTRNHTSAQILVYGTRTTGDGYGSEDELHLALNTSETAEFHIEGASAVNISGGPNCADGAWHHLAATWDIAGSAILYVDGVRRASATHNASNFVCSGYQRIGRPYSTAYDRLYAGLLDEVRLSAIARSSNWIWACYANQASNDDFVAYGTRIWNGSASGITATSAALNATLSSTGLTTGVRVYWGTTDKGTAAASWNNNALVGSYAVNGSSNISYTATGLTPGTFYYYRFMLTNASGYAWTTNASTFQTRIPPSLAAFKMKITFSGYDKAETLANFPALVVFNEGLPTFRYAQFQPGATDLKFADQTELNELNHEIERWGSSSGSGDATNSYVWVQVPQFTNNCYIWAFWGNATATNAPDYTTNGATWSEGFNGVWHLQGTGASAADSTSNRNTGTVSGGATPGVTGQVDGAVNFYYPDGDDYVQIANSPSVQDIQEDNYSVSALFKPLSVPPTQGGDTNTSNYGIFVKAGNHLGIRYNYNRTMTVEHWVTGDQWNGTTSSSTFETGVFHHVYGVTDRTNGTVQLYVNGQLRGTDTFTAGTAAREYGTGTWKIGIANPGGTTYRWASHGVIDEARIERTVRSSNWVWACWLNQASNQTFATFGAIGRRGGTTFGAK